MKVSAKIASAVTAFLALIISFSSLFYGAPLLFTHGNSSLHFALDLLMAATLILVGTLSQHRSFNFVKSTYLITYLALFVLQLALAIKNFNNFMMWDIWGMLLPIIAGTSPIFTAIMLFLVCQPLFEKLVANYSLKTSGLVLFTMSILAWAASASNLPLSSNAFGALLAVFGGWGVWLSQVKITRKRLWLSLLFFVVDASCCIFMDHSLWHEFGEKLYMLQWGVSYLNYPLSIFVLLAALALAYLLKGLLTDVPEQAVVLLVAASAVAWSRPSTRLANALLKRSKLLSLGVVVAAFVLLVVYVLVLDCLLAKRQKTAPANFIAFASQAFESFQSWAHKHKRTLLTWLYFLVVSYLSFFIVTDGMKVTQLNNVNVLTFLQVDRMFVPWLTAIFLFAAYELFAFITTRYWVAIALPTLADLGLAVADKIKIGLRGEPVYPIELREVVNAQSLLGMLNAKLVIAIAVILLLLIALVVFLEIKHPVRLPNWRKRLVFALIGALLWATPLKFSDPTSPIYYLSQAFNNRVSRSDPVADLQFNGPLLMLLDYSSVRMMEQPADYSASAVKQVIARSEQDAQQINKTRLHQQKDETIIFNLSESFADPKEFPKAHFGKHTPDPLAFIRQLAKTTTSGQMMSAGYGGGTANMEYESLTGFNMGFLEGQITPYQQVVPNYASYPNIGLNFNHAAAIHPFYGQYYGRKKAYQIFKFDKFAYLGSKDKIYDQKKLGSNYYLSDQTLYDNARRQLESQKQGQFINLISMQNHLPYNSWYKPNPYKGHVSLKEPVNSPDFFPTFAQGVRYTDLAVKDFVAYLDTLQRPVIFVFYGDHYPAIIDKKKLKQYPLKLHETPYFIYANKYARAHGAKSKLQADSYVNTSDFMAMALDQANAKVSPYQALLTKVHAELPAITINYYGCKGFELVDKKTGHLVKEKALNKKQRQLLHDLRIVQYDLTQGKGYSLRSKSFYQQK
jgi:phosphoglycerol transferase MdoB-like AlkP superfamily enzyme